MKVFAGKRIDEVAQGRLEHVIVAAGADLLAEQGAGFDPADDGIAAGAAAVGEAIAEKTFDLAQFNEPRGGERQCILLVLNIHFGEEKTLKTSKSSYSIKTQVRGLP